MSNPRKTIFDAVKDHAPHIWNDQGNIDAMNNLLDAFGIPRTDDRRSINDKGLAIIEEFEGLRLKAYPDPATGSDPWTIGYGHTGPDVKPGLIITEARAEELLESDVHKFEDAVSGMLTGATTGNQFSAMVSFAYNVGPENLRQSTLLKLHNAGAFEGAALEFARWNKAAGKVMTGLTRRRAAEARLYREA